MAVPLAAVLTLAAVGCGSRDDTTVSRSDFEARTQQVQGADDGEARCIADYVYAEYEPQDIRTIHDEGISGLPLGQWDPYFHSVIGCLVADGQDGS